MGRLFATLALVICFTLICVNVVFATTLFGGVQHSDYVEPAGRYNFTFGTQLQAMRSPVAAFNQTGTLEQGVATAYNPVNQTFQAKPQPKVDWFQIPTWMAGRWTKKGDMTLNVTDLRSGRSSNMQQWTDDELTVSWGHQVNRAGNIWEANFVPSERDGTSNSKSVRFLLVDCRCEASAPEQVITRMRYIVSEDTGWGQNVNRFQQESINDYTPISNYEIQNYSSTRVFTYEGSPTRNGILLSKFTRLTPFRPIAFEEGVDLHSSLIDFLQSHQMYDLVPVQNDPGNHLPVVPEP